MTSQPFNKLGVFLGLTLVLSSLCYWMVIVAQNMLFGIGLIASPALAGLVTNLIFQHNLRGMGWSFKPLRYLPLAYVIPLLYGLVVYSIVWITGLGIFSPETLIQQVGNELPDLVHSPTTFLLVYAFKAATLGMIPAMILAMGEEIGWRGFLVPELAKHFSFTNTALISGIIWAVWHYPAILFVDYSSVGAPLWFGVLCFTILVIAISFIMAWLRLKSGSLWPAVIFHASHNVFIQTLFNPLTGRTALTPYVIDEFGVGLVCATAVLAYLFWRNRNILTVQTSVFESQA